ncbi:MAG: hypothetical protein BYD32DRAFT_489951 [Podila humilis]|nr:MAG: hypothetical protein BYD32DRAFT_489951 [Podila humilis]
MPSLLNATSHSDFKATSTTMHKALSLIAVLCLLAAVGSSDNDDAIVYRHLTMNRVMVDLYAMMQELVNKEVTTTCNHDQCLESFAAGLSIMTSAKPFGVGMEVTTTVDYSYSQTSEESTTLKYDFDVVRSDPGYIVMVNAQARSELVRPDVIAAGLKM